MEILSVRPSGPLCLVLFPNNVVSLIMAHKKGARNGTLILQQEKYWIESTETESMTFTPMGFPFETHRCGMENVKVRLV